MRDETPHKELHIDAGRALSSAVGPACICICMKSNIPGLKTVLQSKIYGPYQVVKDVLGQSVVPGFWAGIF